MTEHAFKTSRGAAGTSSSDLLAEAAVAEIAPGMIVGLGTGRTSQRAIAVLGQRLKTEPLDIRCVASSQRTEAVALEHGLPLTAFADVEHIDLLFDGADEVDGKLRMLKGSNGAFLQQRLMAHAAKRRLYLINETKLVPHLGSGATLPIAVLAFGFPFIRSELRNLGMSGVVRRGLDGASYYTELGTMVLDVSIGERDPVELGPALDSVPGVVDHGLFLTEADEVFVENKDGHVRRLVRP